MSWHEMILTVYVVGVLITVCLLGAVNQAQGIYAAPMVSTGCLALLWPIWVPFFILGLIGELVGERVNRWLEK